MEGTGRRIRILAITALLLLVVLIPVCTSGDDICIDCPSPPPDQTNAAPVLDSIGAKSIGEGQTLVIQLSAYDSNNDEILYSANPLLYGAVFNPNTGLFTWTPNYDACGVYVVNFTATDTWGASSSEEVTITVTNTNRVPVITSLNNCTGYEVQMLSFSVGAIDFDGDFLTYHAAPLPAGSNFDNHTGFFSWTPDFSQSGNYVINFTVTDSGGLSTSKEITITIANMNRPPVLSPIGQKNISENSPLSITISASDPDNDPLQFGASTLPIGASFNPQTKSFQWTPSFNQNGTYNVNFTVTDTYGLVDSENVLITVTNVNRAPVITSIGNKTIAENSTLVFVVNATDPDGDSLVFGVNYVGIQPNGAVFNPTSRTFLWTPTFHQSGIYTVNFTVTDTGNLADFEKITISVTDLNVPPEILPIGNKVIEEGLPLNFTVHVINPDEDILTFNVTDLPPRATFDTATGEFSWIPSYSQKGTYYLNFSIRDPGGLMDYESVTITIVEPVLSHALTTNYAPVFDSAFDLVESQTITGSTHIIGYETYMVTFRISATDFNGDSLVYSTVSLPNGATFNPSTKIFTWTPAFGTAGLYTSTFRVSDGSITDFLTVYIEIGAEPSPENECIHTV
jgi:hypothetical protein